jgi:mRNA degradation ribonuclease J1/J2
VTCTICSGHIDPDRAEFLVETRRPKVCMSCAGEAPKLVLMEYGHKTAGYAVAVPNNPEAQRLALRAFKRAR